MSATSARFEFVRNALDCSQEELAMALGVSRTHLAHAEKRRRSLPYKASLRLQQLYELLLQQTPPQLTEAAPPPEELALLQYQWQHELQLQQKKLADMRRKLSTALQCGESCLKIRQDQVVDENLDICLRLLEHRAEAAIGAITPGSIALQVIKLRALEAGWKAIEDA